MPLPKPKSGEDKEKFVGRCISLLAHEPNNRWPDNEQRIAVCFTQWSNANENKSIIKKIDKYVDETVVAGDVEQNTTKGNVDIVGGKCPDGMVYCQRRKKCVPIEDTNRIKESNMEILDKIDRMLNEETEYQKFFKKKLKEHGVSSPSELDDEGKKKFFNEIDKEWKGKKETD